jgi:signal transduction histidine kinase
MTNGGGGRGEQQVERSDRIARHIHVATFAVYAITIGYSYYVLAPLTEPFKAVLAGAIFASFIVIWLSAYVWRSMRRRSHAETELFSQNFYLAHMWLYNVAVISGFWILMPAADDAMRLLGVMFTLGAVAVEAFATTQPAAAGLAGRALPYVPSIAMCLYFAVHGGRFSWIVVVFVISFTALMLMVRNAIKLAIAQLAAERDTKVRFLTSASHDLGVPLQSARLFFDQATRSKDDISREKAVRGVNWALDTTEQILTQMLNHLKLGTGSVDADIRDIVVGPIIAQIAEIYEPAAQHAMISIHALPCSKQIRADPVLVERALSNFVSNAIKHARPRRILIGGRQNGGRVRLWVIDDGVGIAKVDLPGLFEEFVQGSDHGDQVRGGFGLGLSSAGQMAKLMKGTVGINLRWRHGSAFFLDVHAASALDH